MRRLLLTLQAYPKLTRLLVGSVLLFSAGTTLADNNEQTIDYISKNCPNLSSAAIQTSLTAYTNAKSIGLDQKNILTIVDFTQPDYKKRFCTVDLSSDQVLFNEVVSHGVGSGGATADKFSNLPNSHQSSLGLFMTGTTYFGKAGYSLRVYGLDKGLNDNAATRHILVHGTPHVSDARAQVSHMVGHSLGCFGLSKTIAPKVIDTIEGGTLIFAYYPSTQLLRDSVYLKKGLDALATPANNGSIPTDAVSSVLNT